MLQQFKESQQKLNLDGCIVAVDLKKNAPAAFVADYAESVPGIRAPHYIDSLLDICKRYDIELVIPLIDSELALLSQSRDRFNQAGIKLLVSSPEVNQICIHKANTYQFFKDNQINTPELFSFDEVASNTHFSYPAIVKPADGSCSVGVNKVSTFEELDFFFHHTQNALIQEYVSGQEYTLDILLDFEGRLHMVVPRLRLETRAGEISKGITVKDPQIIAAGKQVAEALPGAIGCITAQCFVTSEGEIKFIEINPRFGGGFPLSYQAGADYPGYLMRMLKGETLNLALDDWDDKVAMLRYDDAIFTTSAAIA